MNPEGEFFLSAVQERHSLEVWAILYCSEEMFLNDLQKNPKFWLFLLFLNVPFFS